MSTFRSRRRWDSVSRGRTETGSSWSRPYKRQSSEHGVRRQLALDRHPRRMDARLSPHAGAGGDVSGRDPAFGDGVLTATVDSGNQVAGTFVGTYAALPV